jgi:RNA ligase
MYNDIPKLEEFEKAVLEGRISRSEYNDYVIFKYKKTTVYERDWDNITIHARGIIFDLRTKECVAIPFKKFFNLNETECERSSFKYNMNHEILEKMDGSMGCIFLNRDNDLQVATPGSFQSDQAIWATNWLRENPNYTFIRDNFSSGEVKVLVCEIICELSKVVVQYDFEGLVCIASQNSKGDYYDHDSLTALSEEIGFPVCKKYNFNSVEDIKTFLDSVEDFEGFVVHWPETGYRIKMKGEDYCRKHRIISAIHPNRIDEAIESVNRKANAETIFSAIETVVMEFPEEFSEPYKNAFRDLKTQYFETIEKIQEIVDQYEIRPAKQLVMFLKGSGNPFHEKFFSYIMNCFNGNIREKRLVSFLWKEIRKSTFKVEEDDEND